MIAYTNEIFKPAHVKVLTGIKSPLEFTVLQDIARIPSAKLLHIVNVADISTKTPSIIIREY